MFVPGRPLQPGLMFERPDGDRLMASITNIRKKRSPKDKHSSLLQTFVNYGRMKFCNS